MAYFKEDLKSYRDVSWYIWEFPSTLNVMGGFNSNLSPVILCGKNALTGYFSLIKKEMEKDTILINAYQSEDYIIKSSFSTKYYTDEIPNRKIRLNKIVMALKTDNKSKIKINGKNENLSKNVMKESDSMKNFTFFPSASCTKSVYITFETESQFEAGRLDIYYDSLKK